MSETGKSAGKAGMEVDPQVEETTTEQPFVMPDPASIGVGPALRARREQLGWALGDVAAWLRIRLPYLESLENGKSGDMPGNAYALGFLRTYARALGFNAEDMVARFKREERGVVNKPALSFPMPVPERSVPAGVIVFLGVIVVIVAYVGWYRFTGGEPAAIERVPPVAAVMPGMKPGPAPSPQIASVMPQSGPSPRPASEVHAMTAPAASGNVAASGTAELPQGAPNIAASGTATPGIPTQPAGVQPQPMPEATVNTGPASGTAMAASDAVNPGSASAQPTTPDSAPPVPPNQVVMKAIAASWVQVRDGSRRAIYDHVLQAGESWSLPEEGGPYTLTVGNAGGVTLSVGTVTTQPLGRNGAVLRNLPLSADTVRNGSIVASRAASPSAGVIPPPVMPSSTMPPVIVPPAGPNAGSGAAANAGVSTGAASPTPRHVVTQKPSVSADDLNARQLAAPRPAAGATQQ